MRCACRPGYKGLDDATNYRISYPDFEYLVFVPEGTTCNELCSDQLGSPRGLCADVNIASERCSLPKGVIA
ncbi:hypothetical protein K4F52_007576 [Lecanicillium sp. MT-2017a]|nr:hypothetical protein K4F52_007576 [Lecanicillium sp. MT-2017a]